MKILILGGTGAIGTPLVKLLDEAGHKVFVTTRSRKAEKNNIQYIHGNAHDRDFLMSILKEKYDVIVDFMVYNCLELQDRLSLLLEHSSQYVFFSSSRVYAESDKPITEESNRLLDSCQDENYLKSSEYALEKAREENLLMNSSKTNWTIIRPYITYNSKRLQLGVYEKENWLYRALQGRTIVFPKDIAEKTTSFTYGPDVSKAVFELIGNEKALGNIFHVVNMETKTWGEILNIYLNTIERKTGKRPKVLFLDNSSGLQKIWNSAQIRYDRLYNRIFDSRKILNVCPEIEFKTMEEGIAECIETFLIKPEWLNINVRYEAWADKQSGEVTPIWQIKGSKNKLRYIKNRYFNSEF